MFNKLHSLSQKSDRRKSDEIKKKLARASEWVEQAGKGGKRKLGRLKLATPSAPPLSRHIKTIAGASEPQRGALGVNRVRCPSFRLPPSQLVQPTEVFQP